MRVYFNFLSEGRVRKGIGRFESVVRRGVGGLRHGQSDRAWWVRLRLRLISKGVLRRVRLNCDTFFTLNLSRFIPILSTDIVSVTDIEIEVYKVICTAIDMFIHNFFVYRNPG